MKKWINNAFMRMAGSELSLDAKGQEIIGCRCNGRESLHQENEEKLHGRAAIDEAAIAVNQDNDET